MRRLALAATAALLAPSAHAAEPLRVYGPGGPLPAMREAASAFGRAHGVEVQVTAGPTPQWLAQAKQDADLIFSGSEVMMADFIAAMPEQIAPATATPLYLRPSAILVRPGNPGHVTGVRDLLRPGHRILVVNGAGQQGLWEDVAGRLGDIESVKAFRANIARVARNSAEARQAWTADTTLDAWLIWTIWQVANPSLAEQVAVEPEYRIHRDMGIALTRRGGARPEAAQFARFLASPDGARIFARWGWTVPDAR
jgi:accessory colonization factor AcfC